MNSRSHRLIIQPWVGINAVLALIPILIYVFLAARLTDFGFPLDDAWIHQTYARNLANYGEWSFVPGVPSAGSTSPLWTILLFILHSISNSTPYVLTFILGWLCIWGVACIAEILLRATVQIKSFFPVAGAFMALEWHLVWAGASGMETGLIAVIILGALYFGKKGNTSGYALGGLLAGIGVWVRPDAITILGPLIFVILLKGFGWKNQLKTILFTVALFLIPFVAYLFFNYLLSEQIWPNTFYAKQAEYALLRQTPLLARFANLAVLPLIGAGTLLLPGVIYKAVRSIHKRDWYWLAVLFWWLGYTLIYAVRLPVTYQHGRYLIPAMPVFFLFGLIGSIEFLDGRKNPGAVLRIIRKTWIISLVAVLLSFVFIGARSYSTDVAIINTEMVETALWIQRNTQETDLVAVHDIGAVGYFSQRKIIDLAGLVTPEIIPIIRDEEALSIFLNQQMADYLVSFPSWYNQLTRQKPIVFQTGGRFSPAAGGENMTVYRWVQP